MKQKISLREANQHLSRYIEAVERGEEVIITRRGKPIAKLVQITEENNFTPAQQSAWDRMLSRMSQGYHLGGDIPQRDSLHER